MTDQAKDPFGRPIDTDTPILMTEEEARGRMAEVAREEEESVEELTARLKAERDAAIAAHQENQGQQEENDLAGIEEVLE